jgi:hypothetical protein
MTLKDLILRKREEAKFWKKSEDLELTFDQLEMMIDELKQCEEFIDTEIVIMKFPVQQVVEKGNTHSIEAKSIILHEGVKFGKKCHLYKISLTPKLYNPDFFNKTEGSFITPVMYNPEKFTPNQKLILDYDMVKSHDDSSGYRKYLHSVLDDMLDYPEAYDKVKSERGIMIRGHFEYYSAPNEAERVKI